MRTRRRRVRQDRPDLVLPRHLELPVPEVAAPGLPVPGLPALGLPAPRLPALGLPALGLPVPEGRAALAASRGVDRSRDRLTAGRFRSPTLGPALGPARALARMAAGRMAAARGARSERDGRGRRAAPERPAATARGAGPHHARGAPAVAAGRGAAADPHGTRHGSGRLGSRRPGRPRLASSAPGMTWAAEAADRPGPAVVPSRRPARGPGTVRPGIRAAMERSPCHRWRAAPDLGRRGMRRVVRRAQRRPPRTAPRAAGRPRERPRAPGTSWCPEGCRTRETWLLPRSPACARRGERRSGHPANTRSSASAPVPAPGPAPRTPPGAGDQRADGDATFRPG